MAEVGYGLNLAGQMRFEPAEALKMSPVDLSTVGSRYASWAGSLPYETWLAARAADRYLHELRRKMASAGPDVEHIAEKLQQIHEGLRSLMKE